MVNININKILNINRTSVVDRLCMVNLTMVIRKDRMSVIVVRVIVVVIVKVIVSVRNVVLMDYLN